MMQVYAKILERDNMRLLLKTAGVGETRDFAASNVDSYVKRGLRLAPIVDLTPQQERKEDVDRGILEAVQQSKEMRNLLSMSPSFCAWL